MIPASASDIETPTVSDASPEARASSAGLADRSAWIEIGVSLLIGALFFALLWATPDLPGGFDGYRHVKQASRLITESRAMLADPWRLAFFWPKPVDAWFGYHLLLAPLTAAFDLITAAKLLSSIIFGAIAYTLFLLLRHIGAAYRAGWVLAAMTGSSIVLSRATTVRPYLLSVLLTLIAAWCAVKSRPVTLALVAALHALSYSMFFLVVMAPLVWLVVRRDRRAVVAALACLAGVGLGLLANPYFPQNVSFDVIQATVVQTGLKAHVQMGGELYPVTSWWWIAASLPVFVLWILALFVRAREWRRPSPVADLCLILSIAMFLGMLRVGRTTDFFVPFAILFAASALGPRVAALRHDLKYVALVLAVACALNVYLTYRYVVASPSVAHYRGAAEYLKIHAPGELVANAQWADYQFLFFLNSRNRYVIGIEPTFMYLADSNKYWLWQHIAYDDAATCGREHCADSERVAIASAVRDHLGARYIVAEHAMNPNVEGALRRDPSVHEVYRDSGFSVFKID